MWQPQYDRCTRSDRSLCWLAQRRLTCQLRMSFLAEGGRIGRMEDQLRIHDFGTGRGNRSSEEE